LANFEGESKLVLRSAYSTLLVSTINHTFKSCRSTMAVNIAISDAAIIVCTPRLKSRVDQQRALASKLTSVIETPKEMIYFLQKLERFTFRNSCFNIRNASIRPSSECCVSCKSIKVCFSILLMMLKCFDFYLQML